MATLTQQELADLAAIASVSEQNFTVQDAIDYYTYLKNKDFDYADLALGVVQNNTSRGKIANGFAASVGDDQGVDFAVGSDAWLSMQHRLMQNDIAARTQNLGAELDWTQYDNAHTDAFDFVGLPPQAWTPHTPLQGMSEINPTAADAVWDDLIADTGWFDGWFTEGLYSVSLNANVAADQSLLDILEDYAAQAEWYKHIAEGLVDMTVQEVEELIDSGVTAFWEDFTDFKDWLGEVGDDLGGWLGKLVLDRLVPDWLQNALGPFFESFTETSPLVIDLDGDGIELTTFNAATTTTFFDIDGDGFAEQTAWVNNDDALLARDVNDNGRIDSVTELFGSPGEDGFSLLVQLDSNRDLIIDQSDEVWDELLVWQDANDDAMSQSGELITLDAAGIKNIRLDTVASSASTISGNPISHTATFTWANNSTGTIADAWFVNDPVNSYYVGEQTLDIRALFLPNLRGFGTVADLNIAMSANEDLLEAVQDFATGFDIVDLADEAAVDAAISNILYLWAGVDGVDPGSRGVTVDARHLEFIEEFFDKEFRFLGGTSPYPITGSGALLNQSWAIVFANMKAALLMQTAAKELFGGTTTYNVWTGELEGEFALDENAVADLADSAPAPGAANEAYWMAVARFIDAVKGLEALTVDEEGWLDDAVLASDATLDWEEVLDLLSSSAPPQTFYGTSSSDTFTGTDGDDTFHMSNGAGGDSDTINADLGNDTIYGGNGTNTFYGEGGDDVIYGGSNADHLYGGSGSDELRGEGGSDILEGGIGGNFLRGGSGDDQYIYGGGDDWISDNSGTDELRLPSGIVSGDLTFYRTSTGGSTLYFDDLLIMIDGGGSIQIENQFATNQQQVETLRFNDNSTINLTTLTGYETFLTQGNDTYNLGLASNDIVRGGAGSDHISGSAGNDTLDGGLGNDTLQGGDGNDTYVASLGYDTIGENGYVGTDVIEVAASVNPADVYYYRMSNGNDLRLFLPGLGEILVQNHFYATGYEIESLYFLFNSSTVTLANQTIETRGSTGADTLYGITSGGSINDVINGLEGNDYMIGGAGDDKYWFSVGTDQIYESSGTDTIEIRPDFVPAEITVVRSIAAGLNDLLITDNEGNSLEVLGYFSNSSQAVEYIHFQDETTWTLATLEISTIGTSSGETLFGADGIGDASNADQIYSYGGNDQLYGYAGNDTLYGGADDDYAYGGYDNDTLYGEAGIDNLFGDDGTDTLYGGDGNDILRGGYNTFDWTENSADVLYGNDGDDTLYGNAGNDTLYGGAGTDTLRGGDGADTFVFEAASAFSNVDTIQDFSAANADKIDLHDVIDLEFDPLTEAIADFVNFTNSGSNSIMSVDRDGTGTTYGFVDVATLNGVTNLDETTLYNNGNLLAA